MIHCHTNALSITEKCDGDTMHNLLVGICENGYPFTHITTNKWWIGPIIALYSTVKWGVRSFINLSVGISEEGVLKIPNCLN